MNTLQRPTAKRPIGTSVGASAHSLQDSSGDHIGLAASKVCTGCGKDKPLTEYYPNGYGGKRPECKACGKERQALIYKPNAKEKKYVPNYTNEYQQPDRNGTPITRIEWDEDEGNMIVSNVRMKLVNPRIGIWGM